MVFLEDTPLKEYSVEVVRKFLKETFSLKLNRVPGSNSEFFIRIFTRNSQRGRQLTIRGEGDCSMSRIIGCKREG